MNWANLGGRGDKRWAHRPPGLSGVSTRSAATEADSARLGHTAQVVPRSSTTCPASGRGNRASYVKSWPRPPGNSPVLGVLDGGWPGCFDRVCSKPHNNESTLSETGQWLGTDLGLYRFSVRCGVNSMPCCPVWGELDGGWPGCFDRVCSKPHDNESTLSETGQWLGTDLGLYRFSVRCGMNSMPCCPVWGELDAVLSGVG